MDTCKTKLRVKKDEISEMKDRTRNIEYEMEDRFDQISSDLRTQMEEMQHEMKVEIKELKDEIKKVSKKTKHKIGTNIETQNIETQNNITIYQVMTPELVEDFFKKHYNLDTMLGGQKALAQFVHEGFLKKEPVYVCSDRSRQRFHVVKPDGQRKEDPNCVEIVRLTTPGLPHVTQVYTDALFSDFPEKVTETDIHDKYKNIVNLKNERSEFTSELSRIVTQPDSEPAQNDDWMKIFDKMEAAILPDESLVKTTNDEDRKQEELVRRPDVLGHSRGTLMDFRAKYRVNGTISGPRDIIERFKSDDAVKAEYMAYLQSQD